MSGSDTSGPDPSGIDPRGPVLALAAWAGTWVGTTGDPGPGFAGLAAGCLAIGWGWRSRRRLVLAVGAVLVVCLVGAGARAIAIHSGPVAELAGQRAVARLTATVGPGRVVSAGPGGPRWSAPAVLEEAAARGGAWVGGQPVLLVAGGASAGEWAAVVPGSRVRAMVRLDLPEAGEPFAALARAREPPEVVAGPGWLETGVHRVRVALKDAVAGLEPDPRALVPALVVGDTSGMGPELRERFRVTGLAHLAAVSGANLTLLLASLLWLAGRLGARGWWLRGVAVVGVIGFVALCHGEPSVLRAAAMGTVGLAALGFGGRQRGLRQLSWAVVVLLLVDPWLSSSAGFALSVVASAGIICWARAWTDALAGWLPRPLAEAVAVPVAAQLATGPIVVAISGQLSVVGVLANVVAGPLVGPTTVLGFLCAALAVPLPPVAAAVGWLAGWGAQALCWIALLGSSLPSAAVAWPNSPAGIAVLAALSVTGFLLTGRLLRLPLAVLGLAVAAVVVLGRPLSVPGWPPPGWQVVQCDVGQGSATVVRVAAGAAIVVDTGPDPPRLERCLATLGVERVPVLVVTHFHADHVGGLAALGSRQVDTVVLPAGTSSDARGQALGPIPAAARLEAAPGLVVAAGSTTVEVLSALDTGSVGEPGELDSSAANDASVVTRIDNGAVVVLATGDVEDAGQAAVLRSGAELSADVLIVPHHGSAVQSADLLERTEAPVALIGVGLGNDYGHPAPSALRLIEAAGSVPYRTDTDGSIAVARIDGGLQVTTERGG